MARSAASRHVAPVPMLLLLAAAASAAVPLHHAQRAGRFVVTPIKVDEDSRCPMNARCVRAGRVTVSAVVRDGRQTALRHFTLGEPAWPGIVLDSDTPDRVAGTPQRPLRYRFHFSPIVVGR